MKFSTFAATGLAIAGSAVVASAQEICEADCSSGTCTFYFKMNIFASHTGYYEVEGCEGVQPTLGMKEGVEYIFDQTDVTNWFHPLGFAYGPDGVYRDEPELEKAAADPNGDTSCEGTNSCQYPQYMLNGENLCDDNPCADEDFGLDQYEGVWFSGGRDDWIGAGNFTVSVTINDPATQELFYFCHIHNDMSGRIKILNPDGTPKSVANVVEIPYEYATPDEFDSGCGTFNVSTYSDVEGECPEMTFLCGAKNNFTECMEAIDCAMHVEMRTPASNDPTTIFMYQMIAHHRNAVNMAKILLKEFPPSLKCGTDYDGRRLDGELHDFCHDAGEDGGFPVVTLLWDIINTQNAQITFMEAWLSDNQQPSHDHCEHEASFPVALTVTSIGLVLLGALAVGGTVYYYKRRLSTSSATTA